MPAGCVFHPCRTTVATRPAFARPLREGRFKKTPRRADGHCTTFRPRAKAPHAGKRKTALSYLQLLKNSQERFHGTQERPPAGHYNDNARPMQAPGRVQRQASMGHERKIHKGRTGPGAKKALPPRRAPPLFRGFPSCRALRLPRARQGRGPAGGAAREGAKKRAYSLIRRSTSTSTLFQSLSTSP